MMTREECIEKYGAIDLQSGYWEKKSEWLTLLEVPPYFKHWYVGGTQHAIAHIACNKDIKEPLLNALQAINSKGLNSHLWTFDGCFNIRFSRGTDLISAHAWGLAVDLNAAQNPLHATSGGFYNMPQVVQCFKDQGFVWGGNFHGRTDPMHFTWTGF